MNASAKMESRMREPESDKTIVAIDEAKKQSSKEEARSTVRV